MILDTTVTVLRVVTTSTAALHVVASIADIAAGAVSPFGPSTTIVTAATTTIVAAPAAATKRLVKTLSLINRGTVAQGVTVERFDGTTATTAKIFTLAASESAEYSHELGWLLFDAGGRAKLTTGEQSGIQGRSVPFYKLGTAKEAVGVRYCYSKDTGIPGAWAAGTPGLAGRATDGMTTADDGCLRLWTPTGSLYLTEIQAYGAVADSLDFIDAMLVNSGIVVTTLTAQTLNTAALPARDSNGSINGDSVYAALLVTAATTNAGAIANCTISYTNSDGTAGRVGTMASFPITAVVGTVLLFELAGGDKGIRSVQSITLGTSLVTGAVSLVLYRMLDTCGLITANTAGKTGPHARPGKRMFTGTCGLIVGIAGATTANTISGVLSVAEQ